MPDKQSSLSNIKYLFCKLYIYITDVLKLTKLGLAGFILYYIKFKSEMSLVIFNCQNFIEFLTIISYDDFHKLFTSLRQLYGISFWKIQITFIFSYSSAYFSVGIFWNIIYDTKICSTC